MKNGKKHTYIEMWETSELSWGLQKTEANIYIEMWITWELRNVTFSPSETVTFRPIYIEVLITSELHRENTLPGAPE